MLKSFLVTAAVVVALTAFPLGLARGQTKLLNVSYDPTRELYKDINTAFAAEWKRSTGQDVQVDTSHGGGGKQARAVIDGLEADVVTLALAYDVDAIAENAKLLPADWQKRLPNNACPYTSTIVFLVRKGNPKAIHDWGDLIKPDVKVITPNPKTSGGARWSYLAAWGVQLKKELGSFDKIGDQSSPEFKAADAKAQAFVEELYKHVPVMDSGARGATSTFAQRHIGDVLLTWENEAGLVADEFGKGQFEVVTPSLSVLTEPPVALVDKVVDKKGTRKEAEAYLKFLYTPAGQDIIVKHHYRPTLPEAVAKSTLPKLELFTVDQVFGGWQAAQKAHFADGGTFDQISAKK